MLMNFSSFLHIKDIGNWLFCTLIILILIILIIIMLSKDDNNISYI